MAARICYVEVPATATAPMKDFYSKAFGWVMTDFGPTYACTMSGDVDLGVQADRAHATRAPLPVIQVEDLEATLAAVTSAGATIVRPIFSFPGGRRFQFADPSGNELAAMQTD
jgi:predicted enzyme related to lactoylglutathione lyase